MRWSREGLSEVRRNLAGWEQKKFGMSLRMKARDKGKEDGYHEVVMESFPRARMLVQKSKLPPIIDPNGFKEKDIAHLLWLSGQSPITSLATRVCEFSKENNIELCQIFDKCCSIQGDQVLNACGFDDDNGSYGDFDSSRYRSIQGDQLLNACGFDDDNGSYGDFDSSSFTSLSFPVHPPHVSDENEKQPRPTAHQKQPLPPAQKLLQSNHPLPVPQQQPPSLAQSNYGIQQQQHPPDLLQQMSLLLQQSNHGIQPPQHPPDLMQQMSSLLQQQSNHGIQPPQHPPDLMQQMLLLLQQSNHGIQPPQHPPYLLQQMPSLLQQSIHNGTFQPVTQQQSIQEQPLQSIPQGSVQDTEMQSKAADQNEKKGVDPLDHFPCPQVDSNNGAATIDQAVADQNEKKDVDPLDHFPCPQVVDNSNNGAATINQPTAANKKAVASNDSNNGAATIDQAVASNNDKPTHTKLPPAKNDADATKEKAVDKEHKV